MFSIVRYSLIFSCLLLPACLDGPIPIDQRVKPLGLDSIGNKAWDETAVRKVLHTFAYGGFASDAQITQWAQMAPIDAIKQILTFDTINPQLSPDTEQLYATHGQSLAQMQAFWSSDLAENPVRPELRNRYSLSQINSRNESYLSPGNLQYTWYQAATTPGINPFLHKTGMFLTNYLMSISIGKTRPLLMREFYDNALQSLQDGKGMATILAQGATSPAVSRAYGHQWNRYDNRNAGKFYGNDDFAREFHQLFFRIQGTTEDTEYHENTTIEHTAWALTGMQIDRYDGYYDSVVGSDWWMPQIIYTDHLHPNYFYPADHRNPALAGQPVPVNNETSHYRRDMLLNEPCLEILHANICATTDDGKVLAEARLYNLAKVAINHPESLHNLPVMIIDFFADDNLSDRKKALISAAWQRMQPEKDLLKFLQAYAVSKVFHRQDTFKYRTAFDRNIALHNLNTVDHAETFGDGLFYLSQLSQEGATVFVPAHDVFGGQTGLQAAANVNIFKEAYNRSVLRSYQLGRIAAYTRSWTKQWQKLVPLDDTGKAPVANVVTWLWHRFVADNGKYLDTLTRAHLNSLLATGQDFGYRANNVLGANYPLDAVYTEQNLLHDQALLSLNIGHATTKMDANASDNFNRRIGLAVNFIAATPYVFAMEGK